MVLPWKSRTKSFKLKHRRNIGIEEPFLRVIDDSEEDYLYDILSPRDLNSNASGKWEIIEDDEKGSLKAAIDNYKPVDFGKFVMFGE